MFSKSGFGKGSLRDPLNFWALNANFKFGRRTPRDIPDMSAK